MKTRGVKEVVNRLGVLKHITLFKRLRIARLIKARRSLFVVPIVSLLIIGCAGGGSQSAPAPAPAVAAPTVSVKFVPAAGAPTPPPAIENTSEKKCTDSGGTWALNACACGVGKEVKDDACVAAVGDEIPSRIVVEVKPAGMRVFEDFTELQHDKAETQFADICKKVLFKPGSTPALPALIDGKDGISLYNAPLPADALVVAFMACSDKDNCQINHDTTREEDFVSKAFIDHCNDTEKNRYFLCYNSKKLSEDTELNKLVTEAVPDMCEEEEAADENNSEEMTTIALKK